MEPLTADILFLCLSSSICWLHQNSRLKWRRVTDITVPMSQHHVVRIGSTIYCGGSYAGSIGNARLVFQYIPNKYMWSKLPIYSICYFGFTPLNGKLVMIIGRLDQPIPINDIYVFQESETWENFT